MNQLTLAEWKTFLSARVLQEQGSDQEALKVFDELLLAHPDNPHLLAARSFALQRLGQPDAAEATRIASTYAELGRTLVGPKDDPKVWTDQLKALLGDTEKLDSTKMLASAFVVW